VVGREKGAECRRGKIDDKNWMRLEMPPEKNFFTSDIALSATLKINGLKLLRVNRDGSKAIFVFEDTPERAETVMRFINREMTVEPLRFMEEIRNLKSLTH
jgi:hypothetical protein